MHKTLNAEEPKRIFDVPTANADKALKRFSEQSGLEVVYPAKLVRVVRTNAIKGEMSSKAAIEQMLANTGLEVVQDPKTQAFSVKKESKGNSSAPASQDPAPAPQGPEPAQQPSAEADPTKEDVVELSPFVTTAETDTGYAATSSLAGSRVNTELKDIASQIDVLTPEFLRDLGASSFAEALVYSSNFGAPNDQNIGVNDGVSSISLQGRARGMDNATVSTDFFATNLPIDFYNIERLNLAYGAQSVLFGLGNAGGVLESATKRASMRDFSTAEIRFDSWSSSRGTLDVNRQILKRKLAIRLVGLDSDDQQYTEGGRTRAYRGFGSLTFRPFAKTTIRSSFERLDMTSQRASNYVSYDFASPWVAAGRPLFNNSTGNGTIATDNAVFSKNTNTVRVLSYGGVGESFSAWNGTSLTKGPNELPGVENNGNMSLLDSSIYPVDRDPRVLARQNRIQGKQYRASIEQRVSNDLFFDMSFSRETRDELSGGAFDNAESYYIRVDANRYLPGGTAAKPVTTPNSNAGKLYIESFPHGRTSYDFTQEFRATGFYEFNAAKHLSRRYSWLGRHRLTVLWSTREDRNESQEDRALLVGESSFSTGGKLNASRLLRTRYYLDSPGDPTRTGNNYQAKPVSGAGQFGPYTVSDPSTGAPLTYAMFNNPEGSAYAPIGSKVQVQTKMAALQSFLVKDRLNLFASVRQDHIRSYSFDDASSTRSDYATHGDQAGLYPHLSEAHYTADPIAIKTSTMHTFGVVVHPLSWLSAFYNTSENTSLPPGKYGPFGNALKGVSSKGFDYGVRLSLFKDRLSARFNVFKDRQIDYWDNPFTQLRDYSASIEQALRGSDKPANIGTVPASTFDPIANPVALYRSLTNKTSDGLDLNVVANITKNWTLRAAAGRQVNKVTQRGTEWIDWIAQRLPVWQDAGGLGWDNVAISTTDSRTIHQYYNETIVPQVAAQQLAKGTLRGREREWRANVFTNYRFTRGTLKGFNLGGGVRWWSAGMTGHGGITVSGISTLVEDTSIVYKGAKPQTFVDLLMGYRVPFRAFGAKRSVNFQLNIRNLFDYNDLEVSRTDKSGYNYEYVRVVPRQFVFSTTFEL